MLRLASGEDWVWRPVLAGLCSYRDITESRVDFFDLAVMNELLSVQEVNQRRAYDYGRRKAELEAMRNRR